MKKLSLVLLLVLAGVTAVMAQRTITGSVTDAEGEPLIGASILAQGTSTGTVTDIDGNYTLNLPEDTKMLVVSYTGFISQEVPVEASNTIDIVLEEDVAQLEEVVVTGYGVKRRERRDGLDFLSK